MTVKFVLDTLLFVPAVIGQSNYFGVCFMTHN